MRLSADERATVTELIMLHGHFADAGELDRMDELFTADVVYDVTDLIALGELNPVGHRVTNVVLSEAGAGHVSARSKGINADGSRASMTYADTVVRTDQGWRISRRTILGRRTPRGGLFSS